jgi:hypothetical protein
MRLHPRSIARLCSILAFALAVTTTSASAQAGTHVGARLGYNFDSEDAILGANLTVPISTRIEFYPSLDLYTPDRGNKIGFNGDVKVLLPASGSYNLYAGGGLGIVNRNVGDVSNTDVGVNLLFGIESRLGRIHPFGEARILLHDETQLVLLAGVNFTLGSR